MKDRISSSSSGVQYSSASTNKTRRPSVAQTIAAYQTHYESSIAYGMRKALMAEQKKNEMHSSIKQLQEKCEELDKEVEHLENEVEETIRRDEEERKDCPRLSRANINSMPTVISYGKFLGLHRSLYYSSGHYLTKSKKNSDIGQFKGRNTLMNQLLSIYLWFTVLIYSLDILGCQSCTRLL